ncbi:MAG TPA: glutamine synthetase family protein [Solirubrobacterales bacterium]
MSRLEAEVLGLPTFEQLSKVPAGRVDADDLVRLGERGDVDTVICAMPDLWGRLVGKRVTVPTFREIAAGREELHVSMYLFVVDIDMEPRPGYALTSWEDGFPDCRLVPDLATLRVVPWLERTAIVICEPLAEDSDEPIAISPRVILRRQLDRYAAAGMTLKCATELEFFLFADDHAAAWEKRYRDLRPLSYYRADYHVLQSTRDDWFLRTVRGAMDAADIEIEFSKSEWGLGQQEVNLRYADALEMADRHVLYKNGVKEMADLAGLTATFMAKPAIGEIGSSCHIHCSVWDGDGAAALFSSDDPEGDRRLSSFVAGQVEHGRELTLLLAPTVNSYKRFQDGQFAGTNLGWAVDNRTGGLRVVGKGSGRRLEHRIPGADVNPYLAVAALAAAGLAGLQGALTPPPPLTGNAADNPDVPRVPRDLGGALALFEASALARSAFGDDAFEHLCNFHRQELEAFNHETVTDWELVRYFERV